MKDKEQIKKLNEIIEKLQGIILGYEKSFELLKQKFGLGNVTPDGKTELFPSPENK